jgi:DNA-binding NtrC family response regulator
MESHRSDGGPRLDPVLQSLFAAFHQRAIADGERVTLRAWLDRAEAWRILDALREAGGNRSAAARALGIGRRTLYTKMEKLGIHPAWEGAGSASTKLRAAASA